MDWLNIHTSTLDSAEFLGANPIERSTWLCLMRFCAGQENGGTINDCSSWSDRKWQQLCRVTKREVYSRCALWTWIGNDISVSFYPIQKEQVVKLNRKNGKAGGRPVSNQPVNHVDIHPVSEIETTRFDSAETERKGRGMEEECNTPVVPLKGTLQLRAEKIFGRRPETPLTRSERRAFKSSKDAMQATTEEQWQALEAFYAAPQHLTFARKDLATLVNNWNGEIDRATAYVSGQKTTQSQPALTRV